jgi:predicted component of type VI protein secretion system
MTRQQLADELLIHWRLLWPLSPSERMERINAIAADLEFEEQLSLVSTEMANPEFA